MKAVKEPLINIARYLPIRAKESPNAKAVILPTNTRTEGRRNYISLTFQQLEWESNRLAIGLNKLGLKKGSKVLLMVPPGLDFVALSFALFKLGVIPVLIDPGMGKQNLLNCIEAVKPEAMIAIPKAHIARLIFRKRFQSVKLLITVGTRLWGGYSLSEIRSLADKLQPSRKKEFDFVHTKGSDTAAIVFTTGSTGPPKGVVYFHSQMEGQVESIKQEFDITSADVDFPIFPLFVLFSTAWGIPAVLPNMDPTKPSQVKPQLLLEGIEDHGVTMSIGSPAVFKVLGNYCDKNKVKIDSLRRILMVGAPVPPELHSTFKRVLADKADTFTPYGATEALPIANISGSEVLSSTAQDSLTGKGTCVGRPFPGVTIKVIPIHDNIYENFCDSMALEPNQIGEVCVNGPMVTEEYYNRSDATSLAKMKSNKGTWHRMGDLGYIDDQGRLWFCGRKSHRVTSSEGVFFPVPIESVFNQHQLIRRSALVGVGPYGNQKMILILEPNLKNLLRDKTMQKEVIRELLELASPYDSASKVSNFLWHECLPTDIRHNAKIFREKLAQWAEQQITSGTSLL
ncbi:MAG: fatty acid CoA ligase family protein [bacterium]|nr:fatty acid CoA ligase family protein [bacterium]